MAVQDWRQHLDAEPPERAAMRRRHDEKSRGLDLGAGVGDGRMSRGWRLVDQSWDYLRAEPRLLVLPAVSALAVAVAALVLFVPAIYLTRGLPAKVSCFIAAAVCAAPFTFISTFFNVAFLAMVLERERGQRPRVRDGLRVARQRIRPIIGWTVLATIVGQAIAALERLPAGESLARLVGYVADLAWGLATFFVIPILALEPTTARAALRTSARTFRERWGEAVTGDVTIGAVFGVLMIPGFIIGFVGADRLDHHAYAVGVLLLAIAVVTVVPLLVVSGALTELFMLALYRYATEDATTGPFTAGQLSAAIQPRKRRWWQR